MNYQYLYEKLYFPFFENVVKQRGTARILGFLKESQWKSLETNLAFQLRELKKLLAEAARYSPYYTKMFGERGFDPDRIQTVRDLQTLPILTKDLIRDHFPEIVSTRLRDCLLAKSTGGSTGQPLHFYYTSQSYAWRTAVTRRGYSWAGGPPGSRQAYIWGDALISSRLLRFKQSAQRLIDRQEFYNCFEFDDAAMSLCLRRLNTFRPDLVVGYANPLYHFALFVERNGGLTFRPKGVISAAEKIYKHQREIVERALGSPLFNTYGSREFMLIGSECEKHEGLHVNMENLVVEVVDEDGKPVREGETGRILVTDLHNFGMPFIRYEIGDLGVNTGRRCSCGRGLPLLADVTGRILDVIRTPEGKIVPGELFPHFFKDFKEIRKFQVVQEKLDFVTIKLVPDGDNVEEDTLQRIERELTRILGKGVRLAIEIVPEIPVTMTGKFRVTVSKIEV